MMSKVEVFYPAGMEKQKEKIKELESELKEREDKLQKLYKQTLISCKCDKTFRVSDAVATAHMYYVDNVYTGHYNCSEYSLKCPICGDRIREYDQPELKKLRGYYKEVLREEK